MTAQLMERANALRSHGDARAALELLTRANREARTTELELAMVDLRLEACRQAPPLDLSSVRPPIEADGRSGEIVEVDAADLTAEAVRTGIARSGCLLVRGLVKPERAVQLAAGIDTPLAAYDAVDGGGQAPDPAWYTPRRIEDRAGTGEIISRKITRGTGALWAVYSPRMLFEVFELVDEVGVGEVMTEFLGERPVLSAN